MLVLRKRVTFSGILSSLNYLASLSQSLPQDLDQKDQKGETSKQNKKVKIRFE